MPVLCFPPETDSYYFESKYPNVWTVRGRLFYFKNNDYVFDNIVMINGQPFDKIPERVGQLYQSESTENIYTLFNGNCLIMNAVGDWKRVNNNEIIIPNQYRNKAYINLAEYPSNVELTSRKYIDKGFEKVK